MRIVQAFLVIIVSGFLLGMALKPRKRTTPRIPPKKNYH
jgi:hypothetical protein